MNYPIDEPENAFIDPDGGSLLYSAEGNPNWLSFDTPALIFSGTPPSINDIGISTITVTATDLNGGSTSDTFTVTVGNRIPTVKAGLASTIVFVGEDFSYSIPSDAFSDGDIMYGDTLTYTANINPQDNWLTFSSETRIFTGSPRLTDIGISTITVTATDLNGGSVNSSFTVTVPNRPPIQIAGPTTQVAVVGKMFSYKIPENAFIDPDDPVDGTLSYSTDETLNWLMFSSATRTFSGTPTSTDPIGISTVPFTVTDPNGGSVNSYFILNVVEFNTTPTLNPAQPLENQMTNVNKRLDYSIPENAFSDPDGGSLLYSVEGNPNWLSFDTPTLTFSGTPTSTDIGISTIIVTATDLNGGSTSSSFTVTAPNRPPIQIANLTTQVAVVGKMFSYRIPLGAFIDPDDPVDGTLSYSTDETLNWLMFSSKTRTFFGNPPSEASTGIHTVPFTVTDLNGGSLNSNFILNVVTVNTPPTLNPARPLENRMRYVNQGLDYSIPENAFSDPDGGSLLYSAEGNPNWLSFDTPTLTFSGTPPSINDIGISTITVTATDLNGGSTSDTFTVTVVNRVPTVNEGLKDREVFVGEDFSYEIPETAFSDNDIAFGDTLTYTANINPQDNWFTFSSETRTFSGTPTSTDIGISTITVTATDRNGDSAIDTFTLIVNMIDNLIFRIKVFLEGAQ